MGTLWFIPILWTCLTLPCMGVLEETITYGTFPPNFIWGVATAAYQVEGAWNIDGRTPSIWDTFVHQNGTVIDGTTGDEATKSYEYYKRDVEMLKSLGVTHYRFSISWSRVMPSATTVNEKGIQYYKNLIAELKAAKIQPMVTLYHWDLPQIFEDRGGWLNSNVATWFETYADLCFETFGKDVKLWITINEPWVIAQLGYGIGTKAPGKKKSGINDYIVGHNLLRAHALAYRLYERKYKPIQKGKVGITLNIAWVEPKSDSVYNTWAAERALQFEGGWFANPIFGEGDYPDIMKQKVAKKSADYGLNTSRLPEFTELEKFQLKGSSDFFGLNYYTTIIARHFPYPSYILSYDTDKDVATEQDPSWYGSASSWLKVTPFGMRRILNWIRERYGNPEIIVTENGYSEHSDHLDDFMRIYYLRYNINNVLRAIQDGVRVIGYTAWSLMDNFEWERGYTERFGLYSVNFTNPQRTRTERSSADYYRRLIENNGFVAEQFCNEKNHADSFIHSFHYHFFIIVIIGCFTSLFLI